MATFTAASDISSASATSACEVVAPPSSQGLRAAKSSGLWAYSCTSEFKARAINASAHFAVEAQLIVRLSGQWQTWCGVVFRNERDMFRAAATFGGESGRALFGEKVFQRAQHITAESSARGIRRAEASREHTLEKCVGHFARRIFVAPFPPEKRDHRLVVRSRPHTDLTALPWPPRPAPASEGRESSGCDEKRRMSSWFLR